MTNRPPTDARTGWNAAQRASERTPRKYKPVGPVRTTDLERQQAVLRQVEEEELPGTGRPCTCTLWVRNLTCDQHGGTFAPVVITEPIRMFTLTGIHPAFTPPDPVLMTPAPESLLWMREACGCMYCKPEQIGGLNDVSSGFRDQMHAWGWTWNEQDRTFDHAQGGSLARADAHKYWECGLRPTPTTSEAFGEFEL